MQRLLEVEQRAASITASEPSARASTQASNFSLRSLSAAPERMATASIPNCLKHSESKTRGGSLSPTNAALAAAFRVTGKGARVVSKTLSISSGKSPLSNVIVRPTGRLAKFQRTKRTNSEGPFPNSVEREKGHYEERTSRKSETCILGWERRGSCLTGYSLHRRNSSAPLVPPKPNEFDMAYSISALRA